MTQGKRTIAGLTLGLMACVGTSGTKRPCRRGGRLHPQTDRPGPAGASDGCGVQGGGATTTGHGGPACARRHGPLQLKNYEEAATIFLDVVEKYPNSRAYDDAMYLLGESLFQARDYYPSRQYFTQFAQEADQLEDGAAGIAALDRDRVANGRLRTDRRIPRAAAGRAAAHAGARRALRSGEIPVLPRQVRRRRDRLRVDSPHQPLLLPVALLPGDCDGQERGLGGRLRHLRFHPQASAAGRLGEGDSGPGPAGAGPDSL